MRNPSRFIYMIVDSPGSPNNGKRVTVDPDGPHWNPTTDKYDARWVTALVEGREQWGGISLDKLIFPLPCPLSK